ncbi:hypothetical protein Taro_021376 [Colocasia esculenta]|uniref:Transmembrane protein n=1 Tax=Colocasia esculenta TaxID=4460 RepID=A0A843UR95_COLES|nr:hypothetical protein [Colocasia esculenta]
MRENKFFFSSTWRLVATERNKCSWCRGSAALQQGGNCSFSWAMAVPSVGVLALRRGFLFRVGRRPVVCLLPLLSVGCSGWWCFHMAFGAMSRIVATFVAKVVVTYCPVSYCAGFFRRTMHRSGAYFSCASTMLWRHLSPLGVWPSPPVVVSGGESLSVGLELFQAVGAVVYYTWSVFLFQCLLWRVLPISHAVSAVGATLLHLAEFWCLWWHPLLVLEWFVFVPSGALVHCIALWVAPSACVSTMCPDRSPISGTPGLGCGRVRTSSLILSLHVCLWSLWFSFLWLHSRCVSFSDHEDDLVWTVEGSVVVFRLAVSVFLVGFVRVAPVGLSTTACFLRTVGVRSTDLSSCRDIPWGHVLVTVRTAIVLRLVERSPSRPSPAFGLGGGADSSWWSSGAARSEEEAVVASISAVCHLADVVTAERVATLEKVLVATCFPVTTWRLSRLPCPSCCHRDGSGGRDNIWSASGVSVAAVGCRVLTLDYCFCNPFLSAVRSGTGMSEVAVPVVRRCFSHSCSVSLVVTPGCSFSTLWRSGMLVLVSSAGVVFGLTLVVGRGITLFRCFIVLCVLFARLTPYSLQVGTRCRKSSLPDSRGGGLFAVRCQQCEL